MVHSKEKLGPRDLGGCTGALHQSESGMEHIENEEIKKRGCTE